jgi:hypothetical protein
MTTAEMTIQAANIATVLEGQLGGCQEAEVTWSAKRNWRLSVQIIGGRAPRHIGDHIDEMVQILRDGEWAVDLDMDVHATRSTNDGWRIHVFAGIRPL